MYIELVDSLRCVEAHEDTWLVAAVTRMDGRHIVEGKLGCPICRREYPVRDGIGWFTDEPGDRSNNLPVVTSTADEEQVARAAALLGVLDAGGILVVGGSWSGCADALAALGAAHVVVLDAATPNATAQEVSSLVVGDRLPFAAGAVRGVALRDEAASAARLAGAVTALRSKGRLVGPADLPVPEGVTELARDSEDWVAERLAVASPPVTLRSSRR